MLKSVLPFLFLFFGASVAAGAPGAGSSREELQPLTQFRQQHRRTVDGRLCAAAFVQSRETFTGRARSAFLLLAPGACFLNFLRRLHRLTLAKGRFWQGLVLCGSPVGGRECLELLRAGSGLRRFAQRGLSGLGR